MTTRPQGFVPGRHKIESYGEGGFRFAEMSHRGSIFALPSGVYAAAPARPEDIDQDALARLFDDNKEGVEYLIVGTGEHLSPLPSHLRAKLREAGVACETMATGAAVRTYNMLIDENRRVAALLIAV
jgi:uncharacterized protein